MGSALLKGWIANGLGPVADRRDRAVAGAAQIRQEHNGIPIHKDVADVDTRALTACVVALKPQILKTEAAKLAGSHNPVR